MPREIVGKGLRFSLRHAPCAHICRYCLISESRKRSALPFSRFEQLVHRFHDWRLARRPDIEIGVFVGPSFGDIHDRWNGRAGDFEYQLTMLRLGGERGMARQEKLFLTKNTLPVFERLLDRLDTLPGESLGRGASPFFYAGLATRYEDERLTEDDRDNLPDRITALRSGKFGTWRSEREWIPIMLETANAPRRLVLKLDVDESNIDRLERASCEEIFLGREQEYRESYFGIPGLDELCDRYGDLANRRVYTMSRDVEGKWLDLHRRETGVGSPID